jgi:hypothetical protein
VKSRYGWNGVVRLSIFEAGGGCGTFTARAPQSTGIRELPVSAVVGVIDLHFGKA